MRNRGVGWTFAVALSWCVALGCGGDDDDDDTAPDAGAVLDAAPPDAAVDAGPNTVVADPPPGTYQWDVRLDGVTVHDMEVGAGVIAIAGSWRASGRVADEVLPVTPTIPETPSLRERWGVLAVLDLDGTLLWHRVYASPYDVPHDVAIEPGGHVQVIGHATDLNIGASANVSEPYVACYDASGAYHWHRELPGTLVSTWGGGLNPGASVAAGPSHEVYIAVGASSDIDFGGGTRTVDSISYFAVAYDSAGDYRWDALLPAHPWGLDASGSTLLVGGTLLAPGTDLGSGPTSWYGGGFVLSLATADGAHVWDFSFGGTGELAPDNSSGATVFGVRLQRGSGGVISLTGHTIGGPVDFGDGNAVQPAPTGVYDPVTGELVQILEYQSGFAVRVSDTGAFVGVNVYDASAVTDAAVSASGWYVTGGARGKLDLGAGVERPFASSFIVAYDGDGNYRWDSWLGDAVALAPDGDVIMAGLPATPTDFGGGERTERVLLRLTP